jgi:hypothetical protein
MTETTLEIDPFGEPEVPEDIPAEAPVEEELDPFADSADVPDEPIEIEVESVAAVVAPADTPLIVEGPPRIPTDEEIQEELSKIALGIRLSVRSTNGGVTDTFVVGGDFAPGRSRWVQTRAFDSAAKQAAEIADTLR